jgi:2-phospho-L-lactate guanylyltransferase (CobY/MobA/RfbA family)
MKTSEAPGIAVLLIGTALLVTTFIDAYLFLEKDVSIVPVPNLIAAFGEALAPLIEASIRMLYLGVMGWIGSTVTMRGITVLLQVKPETKLKTPKRKAKVVAETKDLEEAWERALQEAKLEVKSS